MAVHTRKVTCLLFDQQGNPEGKARVQFKLTLTDVVDGFIAPEVLEKVADANGVVTFDVVPNTVGSNGAQYQVRAWSATGHKFIDGLCTVPDADCYLHQILQSDPPPTLDSARAAAAGAAVSAGQAFTSAQAAAASLASIGSSVASATAGASQSAANAAAALASQNAAAGSANTASNKATDSATSAAAAAAAVATVAQSASDANTSKTQAAASATAAQASAAAAAVVIPVWSDVAPSNPAPNAVWIDSTTARRFSWIVDADSAQWVETGAVLSIGVDVAGGGGGTSDPLAIANLQGQINSNASTAHGEVVASTAAAAAALASNVATINTSIAGVATTAHNELTTAVAASAASLQTTIDANKATLQASIASNVATLNTSIAGVASTAHSEMTASANTLQAAIAAGDAAVQSALAINVATIQGQIDNNITPRLVPNTGSVGQILVRTSAGWVPGDLPDTAGGPPVVGGGAPSTPYTPFTGPTDALYPADAYVLTWANRAQLQSALDTYKKVVLLEGDYRAGGMPAITMQTGYQLYGVPGQTFIPGVTIAPGASNVLLKGLRAFNISFPASTLVTSKCSFVMIMDCEISGYGCTLENNFFLSCPHTTIDFDNTSGGWLRNNRWLRLQNHGSGTLTKEPIRIIGGPGRTSWGNQLDVVNVLTAIGPQMKVSGQDDFSMITFDTEDATPMNGAQALVATDIGDFRMANFGGGIFTQGGYYNDSDRITNIFTGMLFKGGQTPGQQYVIGPNNQSLIDIFPLEDTLSSSMGTDNNPSGLRITTLGAQPIKLRRAPMTSLAGSDLALATRLLVNDAAGSTYVDIPFMDERPVMDPLGVSWNVGLASMPDDAPAVQALVNAAHTNGTNVVRLAARTYYFGQTVHLRGSTVIVGAGKDKTVIVAKDTTIHLFDTQMGTDASSDFSMMNLTLQGGASGFHQTENGVQLTMVNIAHVVFRGFSQAGWWMDNSYAVDNCYMENVDFVGNAVGIKQRGSGTGEGPNVMYMDKVLFRCCQFIGNAVHMDLDNARPNNSVIFDSCLFKGATVSNMIWRGGHNNPVFIRCRFLQNAGTIMFDVTVTLFFYGCYFLASAESFILPNLMVCEGCEFDRAAGSGAVIFKFDTARDPRDGRLNLLMNCKANSVPIGAMFNTAGNTLLLINNQLAPGDAAWQKPLGGVQWDTLNTVQPWDDTYNAQPNLVDGPVKPGSRFMRLRASIGSSSSVPDLDLVNLFLLGMQ